MPLPIWPEKELDGFNRSVNFEKILEEVYFKNFPSDEFVFVWVSH